MEIIPAIDLHGGKCVRLFQGDYGRETVYDGDPVEFARRWVSEGARRLHIVDLDGARDGVPNPLNLTVVERIVRTAGVPVQMGGGVRSLDTARRLLALGVQRVVVGSSIVGNEELAAAFFATFQDAVVAGIDSRAGKVAVHGWQDTTEEDAVRFAVRTAELGARRIVFTDIARDGTEAGPNVAALRLVAEAVSVPLIASGGVGSITDVVLLASQAPPNVEGVIVGRALYSGTLSLGEAIATARAARHGRREETADGS